MSTRLRQTHRHTATVGRCAVAVLTVALAACSPKAEKPAAGTPDTTAAVAAVADVSSQATPLSMNRACTANPVSAECAQATAAKLDLTKQVPAKIQGQPNAGLVNDAIAVSDRILRSGGRWSSIGCQTRPDGPECASIAQAVESDFSVLAAYLLQISAR